MKHTKRGRFRSLKFSKTNPIRNLKHTPYKSTVSNLRWDKKRSNKITRKLYKLQKGGDLAFIKDYNKINLFTHENMKEMEQYMNPIYGYIMCNTGFIPNNFYLKEIEAIDTDESNIISKLCNVVPGNVQPKNEFINNFKARQIGKYIAMKYIFKKHPEFHFEPTNKGKTIFKYGKKQSGYTQFTISLNNLFPLKDNHEEKTFHIILFLLWWVAQNDEGIKQYYEGINETFKFINDFNIEGIKYDPIIISSNTNTNDTVTGQPIFEAVVHELLDTNFIIYNQRISKDFCNPIGPYADCGETTMRNLINLLCIDNNNNNKFNISLLEKYSPIQPLKDFYNNFDTFEKQSANYPHQLNARDAWSKLIIEDASNNITFVRTCKNKEHSYELDAGMSLDRTKSNFLQLLQNLLPGITQWNDLLTEKITNIEDNTKFGVGNILIEHTILGNVRLHLQPGHYYMEINSKEDNENDTSYGNFDNRKNGIISFLRDKRYSKMNENNYLDYNILNEALEEGIKILFSDYITINKDIGLLEKLIVLSATDKYDSDLRKRIIINEYFIDILKKYPKTISNIYDYSYYSKDVEFVNKLPNLKHLKFFLADGDIKSIDLTPLKNIQSIEDGFLSQTQIEEINLLPLKNVQSIEDDFLSHTLIQQIDLSSLENVKSIGESFLAQTQIKQIDLSPLKNLQYIGDDFLSHTQIEQIDLSPLQNVQHVGILFLNRTQLKQIDLRYLKNFKLFYKRILYSTIDNFDIILTTEQKNELTQEEQSLLRDKNVKIIINDSNPQETPQETAIDTSSSNQIAGYNTTNKKTRLNRLFTTLKNVKSRFFNKTQKNNL
jgi:hypothetical protein